jgi:hypothetical protein
MQHVAALLGLSLLVSACGGPDQRVLPTRETPVIVPAPPAPPPPPPEGPPQIRVGQEITGTLTAHGTEDVFELTAPSDGTLVAHLKWDPTRGRLELWLDDEQFLSGQSEGAIVATLPVAAGRKYRVSVADGNPWDYDSLLLPYGLRATMH